MKNTKKLEYQQVIFTKTCNYHQMDIKKSEIAAGLKALRLEKNYTQEYIAGILGKSDGSAVYRMESGKVELNLEEAATLAKLYGITIEEIYDPSIRGKAAEVAEARSLYKKNQLQISVTLDGTPLVLQRQIEMLTKVNAALSEN